MFFMIEGINRIDFPGARHYLRAGHACLIPRGVPHRETYLRVRGRFRMLVIMFRDIRPSFFINDRCKVSLPDEERHGFIESAETGCMTVGLDNLAMLSAGKDRWRTAARQAFGFGLLAWLIAIFKNPPEPARYSPIITRALYEIDERLHDPGLGTTTIAVKIGCVPDYLSALFHKETGTRLIEHIHRRRIEKAKYLLGHTAMRVKEIAHACGFSTPDYFTRLFRRATRQAPRQFRADNSVPSATARFYSD
jgi:AraC-like DNA-binding protein